MGNINGVPGKKRQFGAIIDSHLSRREYICILFKWFKFYRNL